MVTGWVVERAVPEAVAASVWCRQRRTSMIEELLDLNCIIRPAGWMVRSFVRLGNYVHIIDRQQEGRGGEEEERERERESDWGWEKFRTRPEVERVYF